MDCSRKNRASPTLKVAVDGVPTQTPKNSPTSSKESTTPSVLSAVELKQISESVWRTPDRPPRRASTPLNNPGRQSLRDSKEKRLRSVGKYDKFSPQSLEVASKSFLTAFSSPLYSRTTCVEPRDYFSKLWEDILWLMGNLFDSHNLADCFKAICTYLKLRSPKAIFTLEYFTKLTSSIWDFFQDCIGLVSQSGSPFEPLRDILDKFEEIKNLPIFAKLYKFIMYIMCTSVLETFGISFSKEIFEKLHIDATEKKKYCYGLDFTHCMLDTLVYVSEVGFQCFTRGSFDPLFHNGSSYSKWVDEVFELKRLSVLMTNPEPHGFTKHEFFGRLKDAIESGASIVKHLDATKAFELKPAKVLLDALRWIQDEHLTKKHASQNRKAPFAVLLYGASSVGKSLIVDILFHVYQRLFHLPAGDEYIYTRNAVDKHWNLFGTHCWGLKLDDIGFLDPACAQGGDPSLLEIIQVMNNVPFVPPQADLCDKGRTPLLSRLVVATTNTKHLNTKGQFSCPLAAQRRLPWTIDVKPKPQYLSDNGFFIDPATLEQPAAGCLADYWTFEVSRVVPAGSKREHQMAKSELVDTFDNINDFVAWFCKTAKAYEGSQDNLMSTLGVIHDVDICEKCFRPVSSCVCNAAVDICEACYRPVPSCTCDIVPQAKVEEGFTFTGRLPRSPNEVGRSPRAASLFDIRPDVVTQISESILGTSESVPSASWSDVFPAIYYWCYCKLSWQYSLSVIVLFFLLGTYVAPLFYIFMLLSLINREVQDLYWGKATMALSLVSWAASNAVVRSILSSRMRKCGERAQNNLGNPTLRGAAIVLGTIASSVATILLVRKVFLARDTVHGQSKLWETIGERPTEKDEEAFNPWMKNDYALSRMDLPLRSIAYNALDVPTLNKILMTNSVTFIITSKSGSVTRRTTNRAFCVGDHLYLTNAHAIPDSEFRVDYIDSASADGVTSNLRNIRVTQTMVYKDSVSDHGYIYIRNVPPKKNLIELFTTETLRGRFKGYYICRDEFGKSALRTVDNIQFHEEFENPELGTITASWDGIVSIPTDVGDCGTILVAKTPKGPVILGIHYLGGRNRVVATRVTCGELKRVLFEFTKFVVQSGRPSLSAESAEQILGPLHKKSTFRYIQEGSARVYGTFVGFRPRRKSAVQHTLLYSSMIKLGYSCDYVAPALTSYEPWRRAALDLTRPVVDMSQDIITKCAKSMARDIIQNLEPSEKRRLKVYDLWTAVNGAAGVRFVDGINRNTSAGAPWNKSKQHFLTAAPAVGELLNPVEVSDEIKARVEMILEKYSRGERACPVFADCLKDEAITLEKSRIGKVRVFSGAPFDWSIVVRMYLLSFIAVMQRNPFLFEAGPGTVVQSIQWEHFHKYLSKFGEGKIVAGDYKAYDKRMGSILILAAFSIIISVLQDAGFPETALRSITAISEDIAFAWQNYDGDLVEFMCSNPSGHPLTVILNSLVNSLYMRYCYHELNPEHEVESFKENVSLMTYGDDNIMGVSDKTPWFNHTSISETLASVDVIYTMADKTAVSIPYINISDATFLKRRWRFDEDLDVHLAPLEEESIIKSLMVCVASNSISAEHQCVDIVGSAVREYFNYGKEKFHKKVSELRQIVCDNTLEAYVSESTFPEWDHLVQEFWKASEFDVRGHRLEPQSKELPVEIVEQVVEFSRCQCSRCHRYECPFRTRPEDDYYLICSICHCCYELGTPCHEVPCDICGAHGSDACVIRIGEYWLCLECFSADDEACDELANLRVQSKEVCVEDGELFIYILTQLHWTVGIPCIVCVYMVGVYSFVFLLCGALASVRDRYFNMWLRQLDVAHRLLALQLVVMFFRADCILRFTPWW